MPHAIIAYKMEQNDLPDPYFSPSSRQFVEFEKKQCPVANPKGSQIPSQHFLCENHDIQVNWNKNFTFFAKTEEEAKK